MTALSEKDRELIASMADIGEGGEFQLTLGDETINFDDLEERMRQDTSLLTKVQEQSSKAALSTDEQMASNLRRPIYRITGHKFRSSRDSKYIN